MRHYGVRVIVASWALLVLAVFPNTTGKVYSQEGPNAKYIIVLLADGWGQKHIEATNKYTGTTPSYQQTGTGWTKHWMSTFPSGGSYNPAQAWSNFNYVLQGFTDSAAAATALYTGLKTQNGRITVSANGVNRFFSIGEKAKTLGRSVGAVSSVPLSHATPGAWASHNLDRVNGYAIADEAFFGNPNTTGQPSDPFYAGGRGPTLPPVDVLIGDRRTNYVNDDIRDTLISDGVYRVVERVAGQDGGANLLAAANDPNVTKLAGLFDHVFHNADGSGFDLETPTLADSTNAALTVLSRNPDGFVLMVEGGAVDWAGHSNNMNQMIGEFIDFNEAVQAVIDWVNDTTNDATWNNTLVIVLGDHECGYLTQAPGIFPDQPLGQVNAATLALEKVYSGSDGRKASWNDANSNNVIDAGETVHWAWNSSGHSNSLIPLFARGVGAELFAGFATGNDPVRGAYLDNTDVFSVMDSVTGDTGDTPEITSPTPGSTLTTSTVTFQWSAGSGVNEYWPQVGTTAGSPKDIYDQTSGTNTSAVVSGIPINGNPIFVRLWWRIGSVWNKADYTYQTDSGGNQAPNGVINTPSGPQTINVGQSVNFTGTGTDPNNNLPLTHLWNFGAGSGVANSTAEDPGNRTFNTAGMFTVTYRVTDSLGLADSTPATVQITVQASSGVPAITSPTPGSTLTTSTVPFQWSAGSGINEYWLQVGTTQASPKDIFDQSTGTATSATVSSIPINGNPVYVRLWWRIGSTWFKADYTYPTQGGGGGNQAPNGVINTPAAPQTINVGQSVNFTGTGTDPNNNLPLTHLWNFGAGSGVANSTAEDPGNRTFNTAGMFTVTYRVTDSLGLADSTPATVQITVQASSVPGITSPPPGSTLTTSTVTFQWSAGSGINEYWLQVGTTQASPKDIFDQTAGTTTSAVVSGIPINGSPVFVRLWWKIGTTWSFTNYTYQTLNPNAPNITSPSPGSTLTTSTVTFQWSAGSGINEYWLQVGTTQASPKDIFDQTAGTTTSAVVSGIPINGNSVYVRLWWRIGTVWHKVDYIYPT